MDPNILLIVACFTILTCVSHANEVIRNVQFNMDIIGNWTVLNFTCVLYRRPIGDAVLIQVNSSTVDVIRYKNNTCYDKDKECQNDTCFCSDDGHTFKIVYWYKKPKASRSYNFGIETLLNDSKANIVTVTLSRFYNGQGFGKLQIVKETSRYNFMETIDQTDNSLKSECSKIRTNGFALSAANGKNVWIALPTSVLIVFYLLCICLYHAFDRWRNRKHSRLKSLDAAGETDSMFKATANVSSKTITIDSTAVDIANVDNELSGNSSFVSSSEEMLMLDQINKIQNQSSNSVGEICLSFIPGSSNEEEQMRYKASDEQFINLRNCMLGQMVHGLCSKVILKKICGELQSASVPTMAIELIYSDCIGEWMYPTYCYHEKEEEKIKPRGNIRYLTADQEPPVGIDFTWKDVVSSEAEEVYENYWLLGLFLEVKELDKQSAIIFATLLEEEGYHHFEAPVMLAGEQGNSETTVARFLVGKGPTKIRISTVEIDLYNGLFYIDSKTEEWLHGKQDFTLSEIAISRSLQQEENTSTNLKENVNKAHQDKFSLVRLAYFVFSNLSIDIDGSADCSLHASFMTTKEEFHLNDSVPVNNGATQMSSMTVEEEHSGNKSFIINTDNSDESKPMQIKYSTYDKDGNQTLTDGKIVEQKTSIESLPVLTTKSTEGSPRRENILIAPGKVLLEPTTDRLNDNMAADVDSYVPGKDKVVFSDAGFSSFIIECHSDTKIKPQESSITTEVVTNPGTIANLKKLFGIQRHVEEIKVSMTKETFLEETLKVEKKMLHQKEIAPGIIWDFGGQDVFYSTHQTFLIYRAIYLDGSRNLDDPCPFEQYLPGKSGHKIARDNMILRINTIVTYCKGSGPGFPEIMIVLTHKDKVKAVEVESRRMQLFHDIEKILSGRSLLSHLVIKGRIFVNTRNKRDPKMAVIRKNITEQAMDQPTWGQKLNTCLNTFELEFYSFLNRNILSNTMEHMKMINCDQPVQPLTEDELQNFLKFQHSVGRILYFEEANLNQHIFLAKTHMMNVLKINVTDKRFCKDDRFSQDSWDLMNQKGVIVADKEFLTQFLKYIHPRRLSIQNSVKETKKLAMYLWFGPTIWESLNDVIIEELERLNFETLRRCLDGLYKTLNVITKAVESRSIQNSHIIFRVVRGKPIDFDHEPKKLDLVPTDEFFDRLAPSIGNDWLAFPVELGMDFQTCEQIRYRPIERDLMKLNRDILQERKSKSKTKGQSTRHIGQGLWNIGKNMKIIKTF